MNEIKLYKHEQQEFFSEYTDQKTVRWCYVPATPADLREAGYVKREKIEPNRYKHDNKIDHSCPNCREYLGRAWICCPGCGSEIIWKGVKEE